MIDTFIHKETTQKSAMVEVEAKAPTIQKLLPLSIASVSSMINIANQKDLIELPVDVKVEETEG